LSEKTEEATPKRLKKAQEEGDSGQSAFASQSVAFLVAVSLVPGAVALLAVRSQEALRAAIGRAADVSPVAHVDTAALGADVVMLAVPVLLGAGIAAAVTSVVQTGGIVATKKLAPKLDRLNVVDGFAKLFTAARLFTVVRALAFAALVAYLAYRGLRAHVADLARVSGRLGYVARVTAEIARGLATQAALAGVGLGVIDLVVVRNSWRKRLRMGKDEVKREHKESDGDPQMKAARERAHHEMLSAATVASVRTASVVIVNPTHLACALRYDEKDDGTGDAAPVVVATGEGDLAKQIVRAAHAYGVPVLRDVPLARALIELSVGDQIPEALYEAVAEILREAWDETGGAAKSE
jgi:flagellar biosynthesis protein FlhB